MTPETLQARCLAFLGTLGPNDAAHDLSHIKRVIKNTRQLTDSEGADHMITRPAACLHDCVSVPKDSPLRAQSSRLAADKAAAFLAEIDYPADLIPGVAHAIEAHSFRRARCDRYRALHSGRRQTRPPAARPRRPVLRAARPG